MKKFKIVFFLFLITLSSFAQYKTLKIKKINYPEAEIVQIDFREYSTLVHMRYVNNSAIGNLIFIDDNTYIKDNQTNKKYKLLNSFNLPLASNNKFAILEEMNQTINFTLEFEKLPDSAENIDLIENSTSMGFNFYGIVINKQIKETDFLDITSFINTSPIKEMHFYYKDGGVVEYYQNNGLKIAVLITFDYSYGTYFRVNILIQNLTGKSINFDPATITAKRNAKTGIDTKVLTFAEYIKRVNNRQNWNAFAVAFSESMAASNAGYSNSTTQSSIIANSNTYGSAYGYSGNAYVSVYGSSYSYGSANVTSTTQKYDGAANYAAQQNASNNISNFQNQQYQIKKSLSDGYMKINTLMNETEYLGYVNIVYKKTDRLLITIPINGESYLFLFNYSK